MRQANEVDVKTCRHDSELPKLLAGTLSETDAAEISQHVESCEACQLKLESITETEPDPQLTESQRRIWLDIFSEPRSSIFEPSEIQNPQLGLADSVSWSQLSAIGDRTTRSTHEVTPPEIPGYHVFESIASGGMGRIYRGRHLSLDREVAIKVMKPLNSADASSWFEQEMTAVGQLEHDHVVRAYDAGRVDSTLYIVMELLDGCDLQHWVHSPTAITHGGTESPTVIRDGCEPIQPLAVEQACGWMLQAARGLDAAHSRGLVHRDVKPSNLMITSEGVVKLLDLGLVERKSPMLTSTDSVSDEIVIVGSLDYMAPEQTFDSPNVDHRADIYGLGCTLFAILAGRPPFANVRTTRKKLLAQGTSPRPDVRTFRPDVPEALAELIQQMMAIDPADRPESAMALIEQLTPFSTIAERPPADDSTAHRWQIRVLAFSCLVLLGVVIVLRMKDGSEKKVEIETPVESIALQGVSDETKLSVNGTEQAVPPADANEPILTLDRAKFPHYVQSLENEADVLGTCFHPNGQSLVITDETNTVAEWDLRNATRRKIIQLPNTPLCVLTVSRDGKSLYVGTKTNLRKLQVADGQQQWAFGYRWPRRIMVSPDDRLVLQVGLTRLRTLNATTGGRVAAYGTRNQRFDCPMFRPDSEQIVMVDRNNRQTILANSRTGNHVHRLQLDGFNPQVAAYVIDGEVAESVVAIANPTTYAVWDTATGELRHQREIDRDTWHAELLPLGRDNLMVSLRGQHREQIVVWNPLTGEESSRFAVPPTDQLVISADGQSALTTDKANRSILRLWRLFK